MLVNGLFGTPMLGCFYPDGCIKYLTQYVLLNSTFDLKLLA